MARASLQRSFSDLPARNSRHNANSLLTLHPRGTWNPAPTPLPAARSPELMRRGAGLFAEESGKVRGVREGKAISNLVDRLAGEDELALRLGQHAMADQVPRSHAGGPFDVVVEAVDRHGE